MINLIKEIGSKKWFAGVWRVLLSLFCLMVFYSFVTTPYTGDIQVFMAAANQVQYKSVHGLMAVFEAWELKGIFNRLLIYVIYVMSDVLVGYENIMAFEVCSKVIYALGGIVIIVMSAAILPDVDRKQKIRFAILFYLSIFATFTAVQMQAEMTVVVLGILIFACVCNGKKKWCVLSGFVGSLFLFSKSVFVLMFFVSLAAVIVYKPEMSKKQKRSMAISCFSMLAFELLFCVLVGILYPQEFVDMKNAAEFQTTMFSKASDVSLFTVFTRFSNGFTQSSVAIPLLVVGFFCAVALVLKSLKEKNWIRIIALIICWILPIDIIAASNMYWLYHFFLLMLPGIVCIFAYMGNGTIEPFVYMTSEVVACIGCIVCWLAKNELEQLAAINYSTVMLVIIHLLIAVVIVERVTVLNKYIPHVTLCVLSVAFFFWLNYSSCVSPKYMNLVDLTERSVEICKNVFPEDFGEEPVLFLDGGSVPFYVDAPSYSRYFFNLPLQRWTEGKKWEVQQEEYQKLMNYDGKYIVFSTWFGLDKYPDLKIKIFSDYEVMPNSGIYTHSPNWNVFILDPLPDINQTNAQSYCYILKRK